MIVAAGLIAARFLHYAALMILFGAAFFPVYTYHAAVPRNADAAFMAWLRRVLILCAIVALVSGILWLDFVAATMSGDVSALYDAKILSLVIRTTEFGQVWLPRLGLIGLALILVLPKHPSEGSRLAVLGLAAIALTSIADTGHAGADNGPAANFHIVADAAHLLAAGVWVGALVVLARLAAIAVRQSRDDDLRSFHHALLRFSGIGPIVVAALALSGIVNPGFLSSFRTAYGQVLLAKLGMFAAMLLLAAANRFWLTARLESALESGVDSEGPARTLRSSILAETVLATLVLIAVGWLGTLAPPAHD